MDTTLGIKKEHKVLIRDFGYSEKEFIVEAVQEKLLALKKFHFFAISEKIRMGLKKKGVKPEEILKSVKS
ncbi:MAG: hypothetical protein AAB740_02690 [Patescibacteria group bacterium]